MVLPKFTPDHLLMYNLPMDGQKNAEARASELLGLLNTLYKDWHDRRRVKTDKFLECWAVYFDTPEAQDWLRGGTVRHTRGDATVSWRHKVSSGKAYDIVETILPYLMAATFPNRDWFDMQPRMPIFDPKVQEYLGIMKTFMHLKLDEAGFKNIYEIFLRQMIVTGTSVIAIPWRSESRPYRRNVRVRTQGLDTIQTEEIEKTYYNAPDISVEDMINTYLDPDAVNASSARIIRRMTMSRAQLARLVEDDVYNLGDINDIKGYRLSKVGAGGNEESLFEVRDDFFGITRQSAKASDVIEVFEFWGDIELSDIALYDCVITWAGDKLLRVETNPFWGGKPFIVGTYTPVIGSPYGLGALEPILGLLHEKAAIKNQRLDGAELSLNPMWGIINDGVLDPTGFAAMPGNVIPMGDRNSLFPLTDNLNFVNVAIQEETLIEQEIDRRTGTGSFIGSGAARQGERVTAQEIIALREAGGNRLSGIHRHIETEVLLPLLQRVYEYMQQFIVRDEMVPIRTRDSDQLQFAYVGMDELAHDMRIRPTGADHVADREFELRQRIDWLALVSQNEMMAANVNWDEVLNDFTQRFIGGESAKRFIKSAEDSQKEQEQMMQSQLPPEVAQAQMMAGAAQQVGGAEMAQAIQSEMSADGGVNISNALAPLTPSQPVF
jgi:Bacteriophage head to tail connecting protein